MNPAELTQLAATYAGLRDRDIRATMACLWPDVFNGDMMPENDFERTRRLLSAMEHPMQIK